MKNNIAHFLHATLGAVFAAAVLYFYLSMQQESWTKFIPYIVVVPPWVVLGFRRAKEGRERKPLALTTLISFGLTLCFGIVHRLV